MVTFEFSKAIDVNDIRFVFELTNPEYCITIPNPMPLCPGISDGVDGDVDVISDTVVLALCKRYFGDSINIGDAKDIIKNLMFDNMIDVIDDKNAIQQNIISANLASYRIFEIDGRWYITSPTIVFQQYLNTRTQSGTIRPVELNDILVNLKGNDAFNKIDAPNILMKNMRKVKK